jgi:hypothetical protein
MVDQRDESIIEDNGSWSNYHREFNENSRTDIRKGSGNPGAKQSNLHIEEAVRSRRSKGKN